MGTTEDEMAGWHHRLNGHELEYTLGVGDGQGSLACCSPWGHRVGHDRVTELNCTDIVFRHNAIAHLIDYSEVTVTCTGKHNNPCDSLYCATHCTGVVWNQTHSILGTCLLVPILRKRKPQCFQEMESKPLSVEAEDKEKGWCHIKLEGL